MVGRAGFEPAKSETADLQSTPFGHFGIYPFPRRESEARPGSESQQARFKDTVEKNTPLLASLRDADLLKPGQRARLPGIPHGALVAI